MVRPMKMFGFLLLGLLLFSSPGCDKDHVWGQVGMVVDSELGCWVILVEDSSVSYGFRYYEPANLEDRFRVHNLWIRFEGYPPEEWASTCMVGEPIVITRIEEV